LVIDAPPLVVAVAQAENVMVTCDVPHMIAACVVGIPIAEKDGSLERACLVAQRP
jgi:hypothetical protein